jgi:uncharacterized repeat protein (TIGR01451 family)
MRVCKIFVRALIVLAIACGVYTAGANAQTLTVSPTDLSFGVPTGTSPAVSAPQTVTVNIQGQGTVKFAGASTTNGDFAINGNSCTGTLTAPTTCQVSVVFTSTQPAGTLETATLTISSNASPTTLSVPLNGALGAIEFFGALNINPSLFNGVTWPNSPGNPVSSNTVSLACAAGAPIHATLSSTPDGLSQVFQDNTIRIINTPSMGTTTTTLNVCKGGDTNFEGFTGFPSGTTNCFQSAYENAASSYIGQNPDLATVPNGQGQPGSFLATYGVPVIDISGLLGPGTQALTVELDDAGGDLGAATLHLVTNCSLAGAVPGGSITGNPINQNNPSSQTQTFTFDNGGGQNIGFTTSTSTAQQTNSVTIPPNTTPIITDIGIPQQLFSQLVAGTSAGPAVCLRMTGEIDSNNQQMCKAYLMQCQDPSTQTISGPNCVPNASTARNLLDIARFESPDAPSGTNFLASACNAAAAGANCASTNLSGPNPVLIGPGMLMGSDNWLCAPGSDLTNCQNQELTVANPTGGSYAAANCVLTGSLAGDLCPFDTLTEFLGAADPTHGSTTSGKNSMFIPVMNMPLPNTAIATSPVINGNGWVNNTSVNFTFTSNAANYNATNAPSANGFTQAPPYSVTYGIAPASAAIPDTTYPVSGDTTLWPPSSNQNFGQQNKGQPLCAGGASSSFIYPVTTIVETSGVYNMHYFTTDCALTEELLFSATSLTDPTANWASFRVLSFGVDNTQPTLACTLTPSTPSGSNGWYKAPATANCTATDDLSGFAPGTAVANTNGTVLMGSTSTMQSASSTGSGATAQILQQTISDLAGNVSNTQGPYATPIDGTAPTLSAKFSVSGTSFTFGQTVTAKFTCADTISGLATCGTQALASCPAAPSTNLTAYTSPTSVTIDTTSPAALSGSPHMLYAVDCAGNMSAPVTYTVSLGSADLGVGNIPSPLGTIKNNSNLTYNIFVLNLSSNLATNVVVTNPIPANTTYVSAMSGVVSCTLAGCNNLTTGSACTPNVNGSGVVTSVSCTTPSVKPFLPGLTGYVVKLVVKVSVPKGVTSVSDTATVSEANPDPVKGDNTFTLTTKVSQ